MAKRVIIKIGDIFSVKIDENSKKYFQYIADDKLMLDSYVIRAFKEEYPINEQPDLQDIVNGKIDFYAHCFLRLGVKMELWEKIGNVSEIGHTEQILFRKSADYGYKVGEEPVKISHRWSIWHINDDDFTYVGKLKGENRISEIGIVMSPYDIVERMQTSEYGGFYPGFE